MDGISVFILEDDSYVQSHLSMMLGAHDDVRVVGVCSTAEKPLDQLQLVRPDLLILSDKLSGGSGIDLIEQVDVVSRPFCILTAEDQTAASRAFQFGMVDYLIKPITSERFAQSLDQARKWIYRRRVINHSHELAALLKQKAALEQPNSRASDPYPADRLVLKRGGRLVFLDIDEIDWIEAEDVYVRLHTREKSHLMRTRLKHLEKRLDARRFVRIHRSTIVNLSRIKEVTPHPNGGAVVILRSGEKLKMSRSYLDKWSDLFT